MELKKGNAGSFSSGEEAQQRGLCSGWSRWSVPAAMGRERRLWFGVNPLARISNIEMCGSPNLLEGGYKFWHEEATWWEGRGRDHASKQRGPWLTTTSPIIIVSAQPIGPPHRSPGDVTNHNQQRFRSSHIGPAVFKFKNYFLFSIYPPYRICIFKNFFFTFHIHVPRKTHISRKKIFFPTQSPTAKHRTLA